MRIGIIGAGPGGLAAACLLKAKGFEVEIFEALDRPGGRNAEHTLKDAKGGAYHFDTGPTFFLMPDILKEIFEKCSSELSAYLDLRRLDPLYSLRFGDGTEFCPSFDTQKTIQEIEKFSFADSKRFLDFQKHQSKKFAALFPSFRRAFRGPGDLFSKSVLGALPFFKRSSIYDELAENFESEHMRLAFAFQTNFLGLSPYDCPSLLSIVSHSEHDQGVWHPIGGCNRISLALAKLFKDLGGHIHYNTPVKEVLVRNKHVKAFVLENKTHIYFDAAVMNADFAHGMQSLFAEEDRKSYKNAQLDDLKLSCSSFMLYLGLDKIPDWPMHAIYFAQNYRKNIRELYSGALSDDFTFYIHNPSRLDPTRAPAEKSALYIFAPVPNLDAKIDWEKEAPLLKEKIFNRIQSRTGMDLRAHVVCEKTTTPLDWQNEYRVYKGAIFSLAYDWDQMLFLRPQNKLDDFDNLYLVGGATHPGSGLPAILQSALISSELISQQSETLYQPKFFDLRRPLRKKLNKKIALTLKNFRGAKTAYGSSHSNS